MSWKPSDPKPRYLDIGPRFDPDDPSRPNRGLNSGRLAMRLVVASILVLMLGLTVAGRGDVAAGIGWLVLAPLLVVLAMVELAASASGRVWGADEVDW